jgi:hypothetical protein
LSWLFLPTPWVAACIGGSIAFDGNERDETSLAATVTIPDVAIAPNATSVLCKRAVKSGIGQSPIFGIGEALQEAVSQ